MELDKNNMKKLMCLIVFTILLLVGITNLGTVLQFIRLLFSIIFPFLLGGAIAFVINIPMKSLEKHLFLNRKWKDKKWAKKMERPCSLLLSLILIIAAIAVVILVVVPQLGDTLVKLSRDIQNFWPRVQEWGIKLFDDNPEITGWINNLQMNWEKIIQQAIEFLKTGAGTILDSTFSVAKVIVNATMNFVIAFVFAIYIVLQKEKLSIQVKKVMYAFIPEKRVELILRVCGQIHITFTNFITGQCVEAVILGTMFFAAMIILRFPYAMLVGILIAFTALIPIFGAFIGCVVGTLLIFMESPMQAVGFVILFFILQQVEGNLIYPHVVGNSVGLPSIWVLVAVTLGGNLMGIVGMLIFIPLVAVFYSLFREYVYKRLRKQNLIKKTERSETK